MKKLYNFKGPFYFKALIITCCRIDWKFAAEITLNVQKRIIAEVGYKSDAVDATLI